MTIKTHVPLLSVLLRQPKSQTQCNKTQSQHQNNSTRSVETIERMLHDQHVLLHRPGHAAHAMLGVARLGSTRMRANLCPANWLDWQSHRPHERWRR